MVNAGALRPVAALLLALNLCMYTIIAVLGGWAINVAMDNGFFIDSGLLLPSNFSPFFIPMGNEATGLFVILSVLAGVVGAAAAIAGFYHIQSWSSTTLSAASCWGFIAWALTILSMGLAVKEIDLDGRNAKLRTMEAFSIILSGTQLFYLLAIHAGRNNSSY